MTSRVARVRSIEEGLPEEVQYQCLRMVRTFLCGAVTLER
jgi:hypothetical protein